MQVVSTQRLRRLVQRTVVALFAALFATSVPAARAQDSSTANALIDVSRPVAARSKRAETGTILSGPQAVTRRATQIYARLPLSFEANQGQAPKAVQFLSRGKGYTLLLSGNDAVLSLKSRRMADASVTMRLVGANPKAAGSGTD